MTRDLRGPEQTPTLAQEPDLCLQILNKDGYAFFQAEDGLVVNRHAAYTRLQKERLNTGLPIHVRQGAHELAYTGLPP